jgi:NAD(P)-dependent dehydrogenase (short-subunit alcohol dehydrogenase family)
MIPPVVAVTGVTQGLGRALSAGLAASGAQVVMVCRDPERGESVRRDVAAVATGPRPELVVADLADLSSVRRAADEVHSAHDRLDALVNNAAASPGPASRAPTASS